MPCDIDANIERVPSCYFKKPTLTSGTTTEITDRTRHDEGICQNLRRHSMRVDAQRRGALLNLDLHVLSHNVQGYRIDRNPLPNGLGNLAEPMDKVAPLLYSG